MKLFFRISFCLFLLLSGNPLFAISGKAVFSGSILSKADSTPIIGAVVYFTDLKK
ncbi:MAG TPA: hypothetical protein VL651_02810 [Bacteroidia bacterium]|nr:hypothetical protein [Bacteroidia bacterium]